MESCRRKKQPKGRKAKFHAYALAGDFEVICGMWGFYPCVSGGIGEINRHEGQAGKSAGRMPWHRQPKKDVVSCEKLRGVATDFDPQISEWGNPHGVMSMHRTVNKIAVRR